jgi:hypothetical protein
MKAVLTLVILLFATTISVAQNSKNDDKVVSFQMDVVLVPGLDNTDSATEIQMDSDNKLARLYRRPNTRVKKELSFATKQNRPKLA